MADLGDVLDALVSNVAAALYPGATRDASGAPLGSVAGPVVRVMRGAPFAEQLDQDLRAGVVSVTVNARPGVARDTTRFPTDWQVVSVQTATLTAQVAGDAVTIGGMVTVGQGVVLIVDGQPYAYQSMAGDTAATIAAALAAAITVDRPAVTSGAVTSGAVASGATVTVAGARTIVARIVVQGTAIRTTRQQEAEVELAVLAPSFSLRDQVAAAVDANLSGVWRLALPDTSMAMLRYGGTAYEDRPQKALSLVRLLRYLVEYATTQTMTQTTIGVMEAVLTPGAPGGPPGPVTIATDVGPPIQPLPSDLAVEMADCEVAVDAFGNPEVTI